jgi:hypothetical protein
MGAHLLKVAIDFDRLVTQGGSPRAVLVELGRRAGDYLPEVLEALKSIEHSAAS